jgi:hypothetical protein
VYRATPGRSPTVASDRIQQRISDIRGGGTAEPNDINPRDWLADILACHLARPAQRFPILELEATEHRNRDLTAHVWQNEPNFQQKKFSEMESAFLSLARLHQLDAIFTIFGASDRGKRLILRGRGLRRPL